MLENCDYSWSDLQRVVPAALESVSTITVGKFARKALHYMDLYREGITDFRQLYYTTSEFLVMLNLKEAVSKKVALKNLKKVVPRNLKMGLIMIILIGGGIGLRGIGIIVSYKLFI
ncbi:hypothetical protein RhiirA4_426037 [Rhizophagus irregularis]|uniref:Uncharacterized protein n=1 Tax=Rhizophagus irregularis TaxID=588596 RepID=A0A2I1H3L5_9GLOM|nr:hypothetical protein RhiirA4_426037 [Rhizophagus irregularis]